MAYVAITWVVGLGGGKVHILERQSPVRIGFQQKSMPSVAAETSFCRTLRFIGKLCSTLEVILCLLPDRISPSASQYDLEVTSGGGGAVHIFDPLYPTDAAVQH